MLLPTDIWVLLLHHYASATFFIGRVMATALRHARLHGDGCQLAEYSNLHLALSASIFHFTLIVVSPLPLSLLSLTASLRSRFSPPSLKTHSHTCSISLESGWFLKLLQSLCFHCRLQITHVAVRLKRNPAIHHQTPHQLLALICLRWESFWCNYTADSLFIRI